MKLAYDELLSNISFELNLHRYIKGVTGAIPEGLAPLCMDECVDNCRPPCPAACVKQKFDVRSEVGLDRECLPRHPTHCRPSLRMPATSSYTL